jgi:DNA-binding transcriptional LysR family regulator
MQAFLDLGHQLARRRSATINVAPTRVRLFVGTVLFNDCVKHHLVDFYAENPDIELVLLHDRPRTQLIREIKLGRFDFAIFYHWEQIQMAEMDQLEAIPAGSYSHPDLADGAMTPDQISKLPFLLPPKISYEETSVFKLAPNRWYRSREHSCSNRRL